jgi:hypothetical protein
MDHYLARMKFRNNVRLHQIAYIYDNTPTNSHLRRFLISVVGARMTKTNALLDDQNAVFWTAESLRDMAKLLFLGPRWETWDELERRVCDWHVHEGDITCEE